MDKAKLMCKICDRLKDDKFFKSSLYYKRIAKMLEDSENKTILLECFEKDIMYQLEVTINHHMTKEKCPMSKSELSLFTKDVLEKFGDGNQPFHKPQPHTQKLLDLGVLEFFETVYDHDFEPCDSECYHVTPNYIIGLDSKGYCVPTTVYTYLEVYDKKGDFVKTHCFFCEEIDDSDVLNSDLKIFKLMEVE